MELFLSYFLIFIARIMDVSLSTVRTILVVRGRRGWAAVCGFFEVSIYITALSWVMAGGFNDPFKIVAYALGFASGTFVGMLVEEKLAIGTLTMQIIPADESQAHALIEAARECGFGVTSLIGEGREGIRHVLMVTLARRTQRALLALVDRLAPGSFITALDTRSSRGGIFNYRKDK
ncbi:MAG TPA: DUF5698 domain-containing protein [Bacillota bacterium]|jgi:uncharacterized protein YebE (UPF0316 family)